MDPEGKVWRGAASIEDVVTRLQEAERKLGTPTEALAGWGLDPIYYGDRRVARADFDRVSTTRAIGVMHARWPHPEREHAARWSWRACCGRASTIPVSHSAPDGLPTGELKGPEAMTIVGNHVGFDREALANDERPGCAASPSSACARASPPRPISPTCCPTRPCR